VDAGRLRRKKTQNYRKALPGKGRGANREGNQVHQRLKSYVLWKDKQRRKGEGHCYEMKGEECHQSLFARKGGENTRNVFTKLCRK